MFVTASRQLAKNLEHHTLNEHGLSKRYVRCLQISEVVNHMKDLIEFSHKNKLGPIEGLKNYPKQTVPKLPVQNMHEAKQLMAAAGIPNDRSNPKVIAVKPELNTHVNNEAPGVGAIGNNQQNAAALNNYQKILRGSSANQSLLQQEASSVFKGPTAMHNGIQLEASRSFHGPNPVQLAQFQHPASFQQPMPQQNNLQGLGVSPQYQQHVIHQLLQEVKNTNNRALAQQQSHVAPNVNSGLASGAAITSSAASGEQTPHINNGAAKGAAPMGTTGPSNVINSGAGIVPSRSTSFKSVSSNPAAAGGSNAATMDELDHLITNELVERGMFMGEQGGGGYSWNM